jgi:hypothetical protein
MNSFSTWQQLNEGLFNPANKGKEVMLTPDGRKQIVKYKVQGDNKFLIKLIKNASIIDEGGNLTKTGASKMFEFINNQFEITDVIGTLSDAWFKDKILIYTVKKDTQYSEGEGEKGREKVQFTVANRADFPKLPPDAKFVNSAIAETAGSEENAAVVTQIVTDNKETVVKDDTNENPEEIRQEETQDVEVEETQDDALIGKKFRYSMRTNGKLYLMEFMNSGALQADIIGESNPNGVVSYENNESGGTINWTTDIDDTQSSVSWLKNWGSGTLFTDQEITNKVDREFFLKIFTDEEYRNKIIADYEAEWGGSEMTVENLRKMLYYKDNTRIFPEAGSVASNEPSAEEKDLPSGSYGGGGTYTGQII